MKRIRYSIALVFFAGWLTVLCAAENVSPWDLWRQGYTAFEKGESARDRGDHVKALEHFQDAAENYRAVRKARPSWNQNVINSRILLCEQEIADAKRLLNQPAAAARSSVAGDTDTTDSTGSTTSVTGVTTMHWHPNWLKCRRKSLRIRRNFLTHWWKWRIYAARPSAAKVPPLKWKI